MGDASEDVADDDRNDGLSEIESEIGDCDHAEEDGREFEVRRAPDEKQLPGAAMTVFVGNRFDSARFDGCGVVSGARSAGGVQCGSGRYCAGGGFAD